MNGCAFVFSDVEWLNGWSRGAACRCAWLPLMLVLFSFIIIHADMVSSETIVHASHSRAAPLSLSLSVRANQRRWCVRILFSHHAVFFFLFFDMGISGMPTDTYARLLIYILKLSADMARERVDQNASRFTFGSYAPSETKHKSYYSIVFFSFDHN